MQNCLRRCGTSATNSLGKYLFSVLALVSIYAATPACRMKLSIISYRHPPVDALYVHEKNIVLQKCL
jgi:hypothetical protein